MNGFPINSRCGVWGCNHKLGGNFSIRPGRVWLPAGTLHDLRIAAGSKAKPPKYPGRIVTIARTTVELLRVKANVKQVFG